MLLYTYIVKNNLGIHITKIRRGGGIHPPLGLKRSKNNVDIRGLNRWAIFTNGNGDDTSL